MLKMHVDYISDLHYTEDFAVNVDVKDAFDKNGYLLLRLVGGRNTTIFSRVPAKSIPSKCHIHY